MSADNGIYIGWFGNSEFRVIHATSIDNLWDKPHNEDPKMIVEYFGKAEVFNDRVIATVKAMEMAEVLEGYPLEYDVSTLKFHLSFAEYEILAKS